VRASGDALSCSSAPWLRRADAALGAPMSWAALELPRNEKDRDSSPVFHCGFEATRLLAEPNMPSPTVAARGGQIFNP